MLPASYSSWSANLSYKSQFRLAQNRGMARMAAHVKAIVFSCAYVRVVAVVRKRPDAWSDRTQLEQALPMPEWCVVVLKRSESVPADNSDKASVMPEW